MRRAQFARQRGMFAFEKQTHLTDWLRIRFRRRQAFHAGSRAAVNVVLQTRLGMVSPQIDLAGRHQKMPVNEIDQPVREVAGKVGAEVSGPVFDQPARDVNARESFVRQFDVRIGFVVAQQDIEARLVLLDEIVLERQRFLLVIDQDVVDDRALRRSGSRFWHRTACLR